MNDLVDTRTWLAALSGHLNRHPHLAETISGIRGYEATVQIPGLARDRSHLQHLADWASTLTDMQPVRMPVVADPENGHPYTHLHLIGKLADGHPIEIVATPDEDESDLLAANVPLAADTSFPVEILHRLTDTTVAEAVAR